MRVARKIKSLDYGPKAAEVAIFDIEAARHLRALHRPLGEAAVRGERLYNNDALAHVYLARANRRAGKPFVEIEPIVDVEWETDMSERQNERHFRHEAEFRLVDDSLVSLNGEWLQPLLDEGVEAALSDYAENPELAYHVWRAKVLADHHLQIIDWLKSGSKNCLVFNSLCPPSSEVAPRIAKLGNFKTDRMMASNWICQPPDEQGVVKIYYFSLDGLTLAGLSNVAQTLGISQPAASTTLERLARPMEAPFDSGELAMEAFRSVHDNNLNNQTPGKRHYFGIAGSNPEDKNANQIVREKPKARRLYKSAVQEVDASLDAGKVSPALAELVLQLQRPFDSENIPTALQISWGRPISEDQAREFMDYLRRRALPQYIFHTTYAAPENGAASGGGDSYGDISSAGAYAVKNNLSHDSACPTSAIGQTKLKSALNVFKTGEHKCGVCPLCSTKTTRTSNGILCGKCKKELKDSGEIVDHNKMNSVKTSAAKAAVKSVFRDMKKTGECYEFRSLIKVGSAVLQAFRNGRLFAQGRAAEKLRQSLAPNQ